MHVLKLNKASKHHDESNSHLNTFGVGLLSGGRGLKSDAFFLFTGRWAYNCGCGGELVSGEAYKWQFEVVVH